MDRVLVTGGAGFIGRCVSKRLLNDSNDVTILDNLSNGFGSNIAEFHNSVEFVKGDIKNRELVNRLFKKRFDVCIHLAAAVNVQDSIDNPQKCFDNNICGTFNVLDACRLHGVKFVFVSSALVYETTYGDSTMNENHPRSQTTLYNASKIVGEDMTLVCRHHETYQLPVVVLRPFSVYGPYQRADSEGGVMSIFIANRLKGEPLEVFGDGEQSRDFFYVDDCADFIVKATFSDEANGHVFNAGSGKDIKIKKLANKIASRSAKIRFVEHHHLHAEIMHMRADSSKAERILGWKPKIGLDEGIKKTEEWIKTTLS